MVNIRLNAGCTTIGRMDLPDCGLEVSRRQAEFCCSAEGVTVVTLGQTPLGVRKAAGDWEWLTKHDAPRLLMVGMRVTFYRARALREHGSQAAGARPSWVSRPDLAGADAGRPAAGAPLRDHHRAQRRRTSARWRQRASARFQSAGSR